MAGFLLLLSEKLSTVLSYNSLLGFAEDKIFIKLVIKESMGKLIFVAKQSKVRGILLTELLL